jgi:hypothetical protein
VTGRRVEARNVFPENVRFMATATKGSVTVGEIMVKAPAASNPV